ncbi:MAG: hypothetical protein ACRD8W_00280 [Nitrososphaeraceae archaeon]
MGGSGYRSYIYGTKSHSVPANGSRRHTTRRDTTIRRRGTERGRPGGR